MKDRDPPADTDALRRSALSRWDDEGGASAPVAQHTAPEIPDLGNAELVQLRIRVIALENLLIAVLAEGSDRQLQVAHDMAEYIAPRPGVTQHPLTIRAADHMTDMVNRALHFRTVEPK
jgi:phosphatidylserine/phosphatidylglycerophosphate/cardiolipin synthase-like enzyme